MWVAPLETVCLHLCILLLLSDIVGHEMERVRVAAVLGGRGLELSDGCLHARVLRIVLFFLLDEDGLWQDIPPLARLLLLEGLTPRVEGPPQQHLVPTTIAVAV